MTRKKEISPSPGVALVSTPWPLFNRPSIQLGALKSFLKAERPHVNLAAFHFYLNIAEGIGYPLYQHLSERTWLAEAVYGALLYPERKDTIEAVFRKEAARRSERGKFPVDFGRLIADIRQLSDALVGQVDWSRFILAGFTVSLCQLTSSLFFIKAIKKKNPNLKIAVGGATFSGPSGSETLDVFPDIDFIVNGEGENPLVHLVDMLTNGEDNQEPSPISGVTARDVTNTPKQQGFDQVSRLNELPPPDYDDYFDSLKSLEPGKRFFPTLPVEASRGCWWRKVDERHDSMGCAFCNLNLQWAGYRSKNPVQMAREIDRLTSRYECLTVAFMDNVLPQKTSRKIFEDLIRSGKDLKLFAEIRASFSPGILDTMRSAGMAEVQIGIEALSTRLLKQMNKGTTTIENLEIMKHCEALGLKNESNLILQFPGSTSSDVEETLKNLELAMYYRPLRPVAFWLGLGSPVCQHPKQYGVRKMFNHPNYAALFPEAVCRSVQFIIQAYGGDVTVQKKLWRPVEKKIGQWHKQYAALAGGSPILSYRDGREFMIIRQKRSSNDPMTHRLKGTSREIYLFCRTRQTIADIVQRFQPVPEDRIRSFLKMMVGKRLMFCEKHQYLSLAIPVTPKSTTP